MNTYLDIKNNIQNTNRLPDVAQATASTTPWGAIANVASTLLGIGGSIFGNNQQMQQQQALMQQQYANQMGLNNQMAQIQRDNWDYTNYENQVKHMQNAGLNVGLMYGMSGGGGATMGGASGGNATGGNAPQNIAPAIMEILQKQQLIESQIDLNEAQARNLNADADKKITETPTTGNTGDILLENLKQEGIKTFQANKLQAWLMSDEDQRKTEEYNETYDYHVGVGEGSLYAKQVETALFKTEAEKLNLDANALLNNAKAQGYWTELLNETKKSDAAGVQAAAMKLAAEWNTGEFTNWKTWAELGMKAVQSAQGLAKKGTNVNITNPTTNYNTTNY